MLGYYGRIVTLNFSRTASIQDVQNICELILEMPRTCIDPETGRSYIKSMISGNINVIDDQEFPYSRIFIFRFASEEDHFECMYRDPLASSRDITMAKRNGWLRLGDIVHFMEHDEDYGV